MNFVQACKVWNDTQKSLHNKLFCVPRRGTPEYFEIIEIMEASKNKTKYTKAANTIAATLKKKIAQPKPKTNLLDLKTDALNIIGEFVKQDNKKTDEKNISDIRKKKAKQQRDANFFIIFSCEWDARPYA